ncbi:MAG: helix-turn-helix transcriptional regulator [Oligoflexia bacterium]|nr:helix-turn-helix transcriptional regulator [Oligoflexia bacterium]
MVTASKSKRIRKHYGTKQLKPALETLGAQLKAFRESKSFSQNELAKVAKIALSTVNELENNVAKDVRLSTIASIAEALDVDLHQLMFSSGLSLSDSDKSALGEIWKKFNQLYQRTRAK